ncbi:unnamed protein product [Heterobilharzia americana]|nr:unnamed protein product [Heterobilharzia americana]
MMPAPYVQQPIPIEALSEYDIREILLDGHEILEKPLTPTANFQRIVNHIDLLEGCSSGDTFPQNNEQESLKNLMSPKIWETVKGIMRTTLIEINALVDVLGIMKEGKYLAINPVVGDSPETNLSLFLSGKKRSLAAAADILIKGAERLHRRHSELFDARVRRFDPIVSSSECSHNSFHKMLMHLRQEWRLKLHQNSILGDVSLRSIGSYFKESGNFEIRESDIFSNYKSNIQSKDGMNVDTLSGVMVIFSQSMEALLSTSLGSGVLNVKFFESDIKSGSASLLKHLFCEQQTSSCLVDVPSLNQRQRLFKAQRLLACQEILLQLAYEASNSKGRDNPTYSIAFATQDEVIATLFPGVQITISLNTRPCVFNDEILDGIKPKLIDKKSFDYPKSVVNCTNCIDLQLHRMLAAQHRAAWSNLASLPQPACGPVQVPLCYRAAGANGLPASYFLSLSHDLNSSLGFSVVVASVSGFAAQAASAWSVIHPASRIHPYFTDKTDMLNRLSLFTEWGHFLHSGASLPLTGHRLGASSSTDASIPGAVGLSMIEHALLLRGADDNTLKAVLGTDLSLFNRTVNICRHYYLRDQVYLIISEFSQHSPVKIIAHWDTCNSALETSVRLCFYSTDYDAYRSWLCITVTSSGIFVFYSDPPQTYRLGTNLNRLKDVLSNQVLYVQMNYLDILAMKILGWTRLGSNPLSGVANTEENNDGPMVVKMFASPSGDNLVSLRASSAVGIQLFVSNCNLNNAQFSTHRIHALLNQDFREKVVDDEVIYISIGYENCELQ